MNRVAVIFFENQKKSWNRFPKLICKTISSEDKYFTYNLGDDKIESGLFDGVFKFDGNCKEIIPIMSRYEKIIVVLMSYRIIDLLFFNFILKNHNNVKGVSIQHGIYSDILVRTSLFKFIYATWFRIVSYLKSILFYPFLTYSQKISMLFHIKRVYFNNSLTLKKSLVNKLLKLPRNVFIYEKNG